jgi:hypothetical protein
MEKLRFSSKVDGWLGGVLVALPLVTIGVAVMTIVSGGPWLVALAPVLLIGAIYGGLVFPLYYELGDTGLLIRFGLMRSTVPYADIKAVKRTRNPLSSPALSLDRLHIDTGSVFGPNISPDDRAAFMSALEKKAPHLRREGEGLVRREQ